MNSGGEKERRGRGGGENTRKKEAKRRKARDTHCLYMNN